MKISKIEMDVVSKPKGKRGRKPHPNIQAFSEEIVALLKGEEKGAESARAVKVDDGEDAAILLRHLRKAAKLNNVRLKIKSDESTIYFWLAPKKATDAVGSGTGIR